MQPCQASVCLDKAFNETNHMVDRSEAASPTISHELSGSCFLFPSTFNQWETIVQTGFRWKTVPKKHLFFWALPNLSLPPLNTQFWATFCIHIVNIEYYANINVFDQTDQLSSSSFFWNMSFTSKWVCNVKERHGNAKHVDEARCERCAPFPYLLSRLTAPPHYLHPGHIVLPHNIANKTLLPILSYHFASAIQWYADVHGTT